MDHNRLVVVDPRVRLPLSVNLGPAGREPFFKWCCPRYLASNKYSTVNEQGRSSFFNYVYSFGLYISPVGGWQVNFVSIGQNVLTFQKGVRMKDNRHAVSTITF